jgi:holo-[acyl-carrier protein] synthase
VPQPPRPRERRIRVGIDLLSVDRLERLLSEHPAALTEVYTAREREYCARKRRPADHLAARFAAKEAVLKALGTGLVRRMAWTDVEVVNVSSGRPSVELHGGVKEWASAHDVRDLDVSLSHTAGLAVAHAIVVLGGRSRQFVGGTKSEGSPDQGGEPPRAGN